MNRLGSMKAELLKTAKKMYDASLVAGTSGNLSCYDFDQGLVVITPTSVDYQEMQVDDLSVIDLDGHIVQGPFQPSSEWPMHTEIYRQRNDVHAIVHTHSPYATAFAVTGEVIPLILIEMVPFLGGHIPVAEFAVPGSAELGRTALDCLRGRQGCLLSNHGVLTVGITLSQAYIRAVYVEDAAKIYHHAKTVGIPRLISTEHVTAMRMKYGLADD